jgi:hypothetical protein
MLSLCEALGSIPALIPLDKEDINSAWEGLSLAEEVEEEKISYIKWWLNNQNMSLYLNSNFIAITYSIN